MQIARIYNKTELEEIHHLCTLNKALIENNQCGCFCCTALFDSKEIYEWTDNGLTAICPKCGVDSILPQNKEYPLDIFLLQQMEKRWFNFAQFSAEN